MGVIYNSFKNSGDGSLRQHLNDAGQYNGIDTAALANFVRRYREDLRLIEAQILLTGPITGGKRA